MNDERLMKVLLGPHVSEKTTVAAERDQQYVFRVLRDARKPEIKRAVETLFDVNVTGVTTARVKGKTKSHGARSGRRAAWKKAYVTLSEGESIDILQPQ